MPFMLPREGQFRGQVCCVEFAKFRRCHARRNFDHTICMKVGATGNGRTFFEAHRNELSRPFDVMGSNNLCAMPRWEIRDRAGNAPISNPRSAVLLK